MRLLNFATSGPVVLVDMDGVKADFRGGLFKKMRERIPGFREPTFDECTKFYIQDIFEGEAHDIAVQIAQEPGFFLELEPLPGAIEAVREMAEIYQTYICSSPYSQNPTCATDKFDWVCRHLGEDWYRRVCLNPDKTVVKADFLIDDKPEVDGHFEPTWQHLLFNNGCAYCQPRPGAVSIDWSNWRQVIERQLQQRKMSLPD